MKYLFFITLSVLSIEAWSGETSWQVIVESFKRTTPTSAEAEFSLLEDANGFSNCQNILIHFKFDSTVLKSAKIDTFVTEETQISSLDFIEQRSLEIKPIMRIGSMGNGLKKVGSCTYHSQGLAELPEYQGRKVIYSFHDPI